MKTEVKTDATKVDIIALDKSKAEKATILETKKRVLK